MDLDMRRFLRADKKMRIEYTPFPPVHPSAPPCQGQVQNISGGGFLFHSPKGLDPETQIMVTIFLSGWEACGQDVIEAENPETELPLKAVAMVLRSEYDTDNQCWATAAEFQGRVHD